MSNFNFKVKDYRIIKEADVSPVGVTLLYGKNGHGKSSLIKALVSLLSNKHSDDNCRHGKTSYSISATVGESTVTYNRSGSSAQLQYNDETPKTKLGKGTLYEVEPRFPLKRIDYIDSYFFPNFSFQNSVPIFEDIDTASLFASMFSDVAKISERVTTCRNDCVNTAKIKNDSQVGADVLKEKVLEASKNVDKIKADNLDLESKYIYLKGLVEKRSAITKFEGEFHELSRKCEDEKKRKLVSFYEEAQPLFSDLVFVEKMRSILIQRNNLIKDSDTVHKKAVELNSVFPVNVVSLVTGMKQMITFQSSLESIHGNIEALPNIQPDLVVQCSSLLGINSSLEGVRRRLEEIPVVNSGLISEVDDLLKLQFKHAKVSMELSETNKEYEAVSQRLKVFPCERLVGGLCPYQEQIKV